MEDSRGHLAPNRWSPRTVIGPYGNTVLTIRIRLYGPPFMEIAQPNAGAGVVAGLPVCRHSRPPRALIGRRQLPVSGRERRDWWENVCKFMLGKWAWLVYGGTC